MATAEELQEQLDAMTAERDAALEAATAPDTGTNAAAATAALKKAGRDAAKAETARIAEALGVPVEEAATIIADHKKRADAEASDLDKANAQLAAARADAEAARAEAAAAKRTTAVNSALLAAGANPETVDKLAPMVDAEATEGDEITAAIAALAETFPSLFDPSKAPAPKAPAGTGAAKGTGSVKTDTSTGLAAGRAIHQAAKGDPVAAAAANA